MTRLLLVDDDQDDIDLFTEAAGSVSKSIHCTRAGDGLDALHQLALMSDHPDLIFLDLNMPRMNGWEFLSRLKNRDVLKDIPVIIYSTTNNNQAVDTAMKAGAICFVTKPDNFKFLQRMLRVVQQHIEEGRLGQLCNAIREQR